MQVFFVVYLYIVLYKKETERHSKIVRPPTKYLKIASQNPRGYLKSHWTNTRLVCTHMNAFYMLYNPNMEMKFWTLTKFEKKNCWKFWSIGNQHDQERVKSQIFYKGLMTNSVTTQPVRQDIHLKPQCIGHIWSLNPPICWDL